MMTEAEEREYCLNHCPYPDAPSCPNCCDVYRIGEKPYISKASYKPRQMNMESRKVRGKEMMLSGRGKSEIMRAMDVSYSTVQRWEAQLIERGEFAKPKDLRKERRNRH